MIRDEREQKIQPVGALIFISFQVVLLWTVCGLFKQQEVYNVCHMLFGYLLYRLWAHFVSVKASLAMKCFPFANFSSVSLIFLFTALSEAPQIYHFLCSLYDQETGLSRLDLIMINFER